MESVFPAACQTNLKKHDSPDNIESYQHHQVNSNLGTLEPSATDSLKIFSNLKLLQVFPGKHKQTNEHPTHADHTDTMPRLMPSIPPAWNNIRYVQQHGNVIDSASAVTGFRSSANKTDFIIVVVVIINMLKCTTEKQQKLILKKLPICYNSKSLANVAVNSTQGNLTIVQRAKNMYHPTHPAGRRHGRNKVLILKQIGSGDLC
jgi:hypothetical protein